MIFDDGITPEEMDDLFDYLLDNGYIQVATIDHNGDTVYRMTPKMMIDFPEIFEDHMQFTNELVFSVWQKGFIEMTIDEEKGWNIIPCEKTPLYENYLDELTEEERMLMWEINQMMERDGII